MSRGVAQVSFAIDKGEYGFEVAREILKRGKGELIDRAFGGSLG